MSDKENNKNVFTVHSYSKENLAMLADFLNNGSSSRDKIGSNIRSLRLLNNLTQEAIAEKLDISVEYFRLFELGARALSMPVTIKLCLLLNCTLDDLFFYTDKNEHIDGKTENIIVLECAVNGDFSKKETNYFLTMIREYRKALH